MRLIDADVLADALFEKRRNYPQWVADTIGGMPVVDAVPVVRCKDCKYHDEEDGKNFCDCGNRPDDWFCADGERRPEKEEFGTDPFDRAIQCGLNQWNKDLDDLLSKRRPDP